MADGHTIPGQTTLSGFGPATPIRTETGAVPVQDLRPGDRVITRYGKPLPIVSVHAGPEATAPIRVAANAFGHGTPRRDILLGPDQMVMLTAPVLQWLFDCTAALMPIRHLTGMTGVDPAEGPLPLFSLDLGAPRIVFGSGLAMASAPMGEGHPIRTLAAPEMADLRNHMDELVAAD